VITLLPANLDGVDFLPALRGDAPLPERPWFSYMHQNETAHASVHLGHWKLVAHGDFFSADPSAPLTLEWYDLATDPAESADLAAQQPQRVIDLHQRLHDFGALQVPGVAAYEEGKENFIAPKDWLILRP